MSQPVDAAAFERLGVFYLGGDAEAEPPESAPVLYDSRDLLTHAVCVGMTGSGKTGLCVGLLEEAALDGVPAIVIDPKGDLANLLLTFPELSAEAFRPWVNASDADRKGISVDELAAAEADKWRAGLASWGQDGERIARLRDAADFSIYTPGSSAGLPLSILKSFDAPPVAVREDTELFAERVSTTVSSLLGMVGIDADPVQSREHILLSTILSTEWRSGTNVDLGRLIAGVQSPPFDRVGVMDLDVFYPEKDRFKLSLALNNLVASPSFSSWMEGEPLDVEALLRTDTGKPRISILSIAHLSEAERMFFVSLLLNEVLGWTRTQSGTTALRALVYMDEIYGYVPPVANPPSKKPILTLLKQARAFGVGLVLATQNPVDLDYKALSNAGTWFIGRLQTAQDKARLLDALDGASASAGESFDRQRADAILSGMKKRTFLLHNVHESAPVVFRTRWAMSYLRGPLDRAGIRALMDERRPAAPSPTSTPPAPEPALPPGPPPAGPAAGANTAAPAAPPSVDARVAQAYVQIDDAVASGGFEYRPAVLATGSVTLAHAKSGLSTRRDYARLVTFTSDGAPVPWSDALHVSLAGRLSDTPDPRAAFAPLPELATRSTSFTAWRDALSDHLYATERAHVRYAAALDLYAKPDESERAFQARLAETAQRAQAEMAERVREKYAAKLRRIDEKLDSAERRVERETRQARTAKAEVNAAVGTAIFDVFFGRRRSVARGATSAMRKRDRAHDQAADVEEAQQRLSTLRGERQALEAEMSAEIAALRHAATHAVEAVEVAPRRKDISRPNLTLVWIPVAPGPSGARLACAPFTAPTPS